jgi:predicted RNase H-like nuclease (RuvC/YqgF family)
MIKSIIMGVLLAMFITEYKNAARYKRMYQHELKVNQEYADYSAELQSNINQYDKRMNSCFTMNYRYQQEQLSCYREVEDLKKWVRVIQGECKQIKKKCEQKGL